MTAGELCNIAVVGNQRGLHARAAAKFVKLADNFSCEIVVIKDDIRVSARSIMGLMMLAATCGTPLKICAIGEDAIEAVDALTELIKRKFDEE
jgi:phosphocarrier protein